MATSAPRKSPVKSAARPPAKAAIGATATTARKPKQPARAVAGKTAAATTAPAKKIAARSASASAVPAKAVPLKADIAGTKSIGNGSIAKTSTPKLPKDRTAEKVKKAKLVRDSFTMPEAEYAALGEVKKACLKAGFEVRKSELLRIGVALVRKLTVTSLKQEVGMLAPLKAGRPRKEKTAEK